MTLGLAIAVVATVLIFAGLVALGFWLMPMLVVWLFERFHARRARSVQ
jgi:hypothetical protein